jgi:hypothetical protein
MLQTIANKHLNVLIMVTITFPHINKLINIKKLEEKLIFRL